MVKAPLCLGSCASSARAWWLWAARHSQEEAGPLGAQPLPRVLERAASKAADLTAFDHLGRRSPHSFSSVSTYMVKGGEMGGFGGGWIEHPMQRLGTQWVDLLLGVPSCPEPPDAP